MMMEAILLTTGVPEIYANPYSAPHCAPQS